jgi:hypothetical protein
VRPTIKKKSHRLRESGLIFTANVRIGDKKKYSASLLENEIRLTVSSHVNIIRRYQRVWLNIVQTPCYNTAHQVRHKGICTYVITHKYFHTACRNTPQCKVLKSGTGCYPSDELPQGGCYQVPARATVGGFPYPSNSYCLGFPPTNGVSSYPKNTLSSEFLLASFCSVLALALVWGFPSDPKQLNLIPWELCAWLSKKKDDNHFARVVSSTRKTFVF